jgi:hypothetical protein
MSVSIPPDLIKTGVAFTRCVRCARVEFWPGGGYHAVARGCISNGWHHVAADGARVWGMCRGRLVVHPESDACASAYIIGGWDAVIDMFHALPEWRLGWLEEDEKVTR